MLPAIDVAVVVCEMDEKKVPQLQLILRELEEQKIPRILFVNKIDKADAGVHDVLKLLQPASRTKLILRQIPTFANELITGFVDLALERAFVYKEHAPRRSFRSKAMPPISRRRPASRCWRRSPIMTTS